MHVGSKNELVLQSDYVPGTPGMLSNLPDTMKEVL